MPFHSTECFEGNWSQLQGFESELGAVCYTSQCEPADTRESTAQLIQRWLERTPTLHVNSVFYYVNLAMYQATKISHI